MAALPDDLPDFLAALEDFQPTIPDEVMAHFARTAGFNVDDHRIVRMLSLATQRFVAGVAHDAMQGARRRAAAARAGTARHSKKTVLSVEDVAEALQEHGISLLRPPYLAGVAEPAPARRRR